MFYRSAKAFFILLIPWGASAYPLGTSPSAVTIVANGSSNSPIPSFGDRNTITCLKPPVAQPPTRGPTDIEQCRPALNRIRELPDYRRNQFFREGAYPKITPARKTPPFVFHHDNSNCLIKITSGDTQTIDMFSFAQIRSLAIDILEECSTDHGQDGQGGLAPIGEKRNGWVVVVVGEPPPALSRQGPGPGNDTSTLTSSKVESTSSSS